MLFYITYLQRVVLLTSKHYLLHTTLTTYKTLHKITEFLGIYYVASFHLQSIMLYDLLTIHCISHLHESLAPANIMTISQLLLPSLKEHASSQAPTQYRYTTDYKANQPTLL